MKYIYKASLLAVTLVALVLTGCNREETKTVEWYQAPENKAALEAKLAECRNNPGELRKTPNCENARKAYQNIFKGGTFEKVKEPKYGF